MAPSVLRAASASWNNTAAGTWLTDANWNPAAAPGSTASTTNTDTATFGNVITAARTITVDTNRNIQNITFDGAGFSYLLSGGSLWLSSGGSVTVNDSVSARQRILSPITLQGDGGTYSFVSNDADAAQGLLISSTVTGVATSPNVTTLTLSGTNTGVSANATTGTGNAITGIISDGAAGGKVALTKTGAGAWVLAGANTFTGGLSVSQGLLRATEASSLGGVGNFVTLSGGELVLANSSGTNFGRDITVIGAAKIVSDRGAAGAGTTHTLGALSISNQTLSIGSGSFVTSGTAQVSVLGTTLTGNATFEIVNGASNTTVLQLGALNGGANSITKIGNGDLALSAAATSFSGDTFIKAGTLRIANSTALGASAVTLGDSTLGADATLQFTASNMGVANNVTVAGGVGTRTIRWQLTSVGVIPMSGNVILGKSLTLIQEGSPTSGTRKTEFSGSFTGTGDLILQENSPSIATNLTFLEITASGSVNVDGQIINNGSGTRGSQISGVIGGNVDTIIQDSATGALRLTGTNTSFVGSVEVREGSLLLPSGGSSQLSSSNVVSVDTGGAFSFASAALVVDPTIAGLNDGINGGGIVETGGTTSRTLTLGGTGSYAFAGMIQNGTVVGGTLALSKTGAGIQTLSGANTYGGGTTISGGMLLVNGTHSGGNSYSINSGGTLGGSGTITSAGNASMNLNAGGKLAPGAATPGTLTLDLGTGSLNLTDGVSATGTSALRYQLATPGTSDGIVLNNGASTLAIGDGVLEFDDFVFTDAGGLAAGEYTLIQTGTVISGTLGSGVSGILTPELTGTLSKNGDQSDLILTVSPVPEPSSLAGLFVGTALLVRRRRRSGANC